MKRKYLIFCAAGVISIPIWMWGAWLLTPKKKMVLAIINKTEATPKSRQHLALTWLLNNEKYTKTRKKLYDLRSDYFGFYPSGDASYKIKGMERFSSGQLDQLSNDCDGAYYVDTYGVYGSDLAEEGSGSRKKTGLIYGGLSAQDMNFLRRLKSRNKLIIAEFNTLEAPTGVNIRKEFENEFGLRWSGWTCKYFESLDPTENKELPHWLVTNYKVRNKGKWPFKKDGLAFVDSIGGVVILEDFIHLNNPVPNIQTPKEQQKQLHLPESIKFPFWFDIIIPDTTRNKVLAGININLTEKGKNLLVVNQIPLQIPAIIGHQGSDYQFYYFSGSFCSTNTLSESSSHFKWISEFKSFLYNEDDTLEPTSFFWNFYRPLMATVLQNYYRKISAKRRK